MPTNLPQGDLLISYNGYTFPLETETQGVEIKPVSDPAGRVVSYNLYSFTIRSFIRKDANQTGTTDTTMESLRKLLTAYAAPFRYEAVGLGGISINVAGVKDVVWGPKPRMLRWQPRGQLVCEILWAVEVAIPECDNASYAFAAMEYNFRLNWEIDAGGYTRRIYSGHLRIPQTRTGPAVRTLSDNADLYRNKVVPAVPIGFRRESQDFTLSEDKCKLEFSITDVEHPATNYPPEGVVLVSASHEVASNPPYCGYSWSGTIEATYEMARDQDRRKALQCFYDLMQDRIDAIRANVPVVPTNEQANIKPGTFIMLQFRASEPEIYGRRHAAFSCRYQTVLSLPSLLQSSALWRPVPGDTWDKWYLSLQSTAFSNRGNAQMAFANNGDALIDLCLPTAPPEIMLQAAQVAMKPSVPKMQIPFRVSAETSWLDYDSRLLFEQIDDTICLKTLPTEAISLNTLPETLPLQAAPVIAGGSYLSTERGVRVSGNTPGPELSRVGSLSTYPALTDPATQDRKVQVRARPSTQVRMVGCAARVGYPITPPALIKIGEAIATPANGRGDGFSQWVAGTDCLGYSIYFATWSLRYIFDRMLAGNIALPTVDNPMGGNAP